MSITCKYAKYADKFIHSFPLLSSVAGKLPVPDLTAKLVLVWIPFML